MSEGISNRLEALGVSGQPEVAGRVIEVGAENKLVSAKLSQVSDESVELPTAVQLIHEVRMSGSHQLILQRDGFPTVFSDVGDYKSIVKATDLFDGVVYCATGEHYKGTLPETFKITEVPCLQTRG